MATWWEERAGSCKLSSVCQWHTSSINLQDTKETDNNHVLKCSNPDSGNSVGRINNCGVFPNKVHGEMERGKGKREMEELSPALFLCFLAGSRFVSLAGLELMIILDPPASVTRVPGC